ncbi:hypothetical protein PC116_g12861 [Phytophthora cactorum]|uniref:Uncharacterized protein n=1 Tax=Phytophthora cactorum TaxID=29920 RepID=A0A329SAU2_9STRA|nr:hypothetical protein Pcac1_g25483 [Phytophthora cactorum]KAG2794830.1 hypothetical protein PC112_g22886 [Phytophthora cactorum]KAG2826427.1 hypothetical protein PC111_g8969 [Phytophthora cactorum]KAG2910543.1 hypothetical protein PC114_g9743 [Phytophthora cactorum]KAG2919940.1 hypothetical protein PC117_g16674 [Phytophthora cactorum]
MSYELTSTVNDVMCVSVLMPLDTCGDDTSVDRALVPPSNIFGASAATSPTLAALLIPFESDARITELTIDGYVDTYGLIRGTVSSEGDGRIRNDREQWGFSNFCGLSMVSRFIFIPVKNTLRVYSF